MTIYVVESIYDYTYQVGYSTSREIAEKKCKEYKKEIKNRPFWVKEYTINKDKWCEFDCD